QPGVEELDHGRSKSRVVQFNCLCKTIQNAVEELTRPPLTARLVIDKVENHAEMHEPQGGWKKLLRFLADACFGNGFAEDGHALRALHLGTFPENGEGVLRVCRVAKERSEEAPVVMQNFQFRMEDD